MPSAQVIDFGEDPYANAMGGFAKNFLGSFNERQAQNKNNQIFSKIKEKYGKNAKPEDIFKDVLEAEGMDQSYKKNLLGDIKDYASLSNKKELTPYQQAMLDIKQDELKVKKNKVDDEKPITPYQSKALANAEARLKLEEQKLNQAATREEKNLPTLIDKYSSKVLKDSDVKLKPHEKVEMNDFIQQLMTDKEEPMTINQAFDKAYQYIEARRDIVDNFKIAERPNPFIGQPGQKELQQSMEKAYKQLEFLYEEDGIDNQRELKAILSRGGWQSEEITAMLQKLFQSKGKKLSSKKSKAQVPVDQQGVTSQVAGLDDILFGE